MKHPIPAQSISESLPPSIHLLGKPTVPKELYKYGAFDSVKEVLHKKELVFVYAGLW